MMLENDESMQTNTQPVPPMEKLDEEHHLESQILNLKNMGYT